MKSQIQSQPKPATKAKTAKRLADFRFFLRAFSGLAKSGPKARKPKS